MVPQLPAPRRLGPLIVPAAHRDTKDPCPVFDGVRWHIFGSGGSSKTEVWQILHLTADVPEGPWIEHEPVSLSGLQGIHVAAPGVLFEAATGFFHMFVQTEFMGLGGRVEHLISRDGESFERMESALLSVPDTPEAGIYDPHPAEIGEEMYLTYSGNAQVAHPDLYLARSVSHDWDGPWERIGRILRHEEVPHHNQHDSPEYEWGLEGSQLLRLPGGTFLLIAVCFLPSGKKGLRQRVFFAAASQVMGPYRTLGPVLTPRDEAEWESGENGHAAATVVGETLHLFYQARSLDEENNPWRYGLASFDVAEVEIYARYVAASGFDYKI